MTRTKTSLFLAIAACSIAFSHVALAGSVRVTPKVSIDEWNKCRDKHYAEIQACVKAGKRMSECMKEIPDPCGPFPGSAK